MTHRYSKLQILAIMRMLSYAGLLTFILILKNSVLFSQVSISGPTCVIAGTVYHYHVKGSWKTTSTMQVCVTGGVIVYKDSSRLSCTPHGGKPLESVLVVWGNSGGASLTASSADGNYTLTVFTTFPLQAGSINSSSKKQTITFKGTPATIICSPPKGGSCSPAYSNQWQQSSDRVSWVNMNGFTGEDLSIGIPMTQTTFFRRKVTESKAGVIAYSDLADVYVIRDSVIVKEP